MATTELGVIDAAAVLSALPPCSTMQVESDGERIWTSMEVCGTAGIQFSGGAEPGQCSVLFEDLVKKVVHNKDSEQVMPTPLAILLEDGGVLLESVHFVPEVQPLDLVDAMVADDPILACLANSQTNIHMYHHKGGTWMAATTSGQMFGWKVSDRCIWGEYTWHKGPLSHIARHDGPDRLGLWRPADSFDVRFGYNDRWGLCTVHGSWFVAYSHYPLDANTKEVLVCDTFCPKYKVPRELLVSLDPASCLRIRGSTLTSLDSCVWADLFPDNSMPADVFADMLLEVSRFLPDQDVAFEAAGGRLVAQGTNWWYVSNSVVSQAAEGKYLYDQWAPR